MRGISFLSRPTFAFAALTLFSSSLLAQIRDGGIDPNNLGKGEWLYYMSSATNRLGGNVSAITNESSLFLYLKSQGIRYVIIKAATSEQLFNGSYSFPQFTSNLVNIAHQCGMLIMGYNRSYGADVQAEIGISDYVFRQGADGFIWDAEAEWESNQPWIGTNGPALAWQLCSAVRSNWPTKFLAHAPFPIISYHSSFPYKEFGYWCDAVMPQIYHFSSSGIKRSPSAAIEWTDVNWYQWQNSLVGQSSVIDGRTIYWTNAIKPHVPIHDVYGPLYTSPHPNKDVMEFMDYIAADVNSVSPGGINGVNFFRADLHGSVQWGHIKAGTSGAWPGVVNNIVLDDASAVVTGPWTMVRTFYNGQFYGGATDTNNFGTNYLVTAQGQGDNAVDFRPRVVTAGDYAVYQWHPFLPEASAQVPFIIDYYGGTTNLFVNQQTNDGNWSFVGKFFFDPGTPASIRITDAIPEPDGVAMADGLKLVFAPPAFPPSAPLRLSAAPVSYSQIHLSWTDTATNESGFVIGRATTPGGPYADAGSVPANVHEFDSTGLLPETTYYYVVRATNYLGSSSNSGQASAKTPAFTPVVVYGDNTWGQLFAPKPAVTAVAVAAGSWHDLALRSDGVVVAWGDNWLGQCSVPSMLSNVVAIAAGGYHSLALRADGTVVGWGDNTYGQAAPPSPLKNAIAVAAGTWHSLALMRDGGVMAWGDNGLRQSSVPPGLKGVVAIAAGGKHSLALKADGTLAAWGENTDSFGNFVGQSLVPFGLSNVVAIAAGAYHNLVLQGDGSVLGWGDNSQGQCSVPNALSGVVALAAGAAHSLALRNDGTVVAWGANGSGQCQAPSNFSDVIGLGAGDSSSVVLLAGNVPYARLMHPLWQTNRFSFLLQTLNRKQYVLEFNGSLGAGGWASLRTNQGNGALLLISDSSAALSHGFYRVRQF